MTKFFVDGISVFKQSLRKIFIFLVQNQGDKLELFFQRFPMAQKQGNIIRAYFLLARISLRVIAE